MSSVLVPAMFRRCALTRRAEGVTGQLGAAEKKGQVNSSLLLFTFKMDEDDDIYGDANIELGQGPVARAFIFLSP